MFQIASFKLVFTDFTEFFFQTTVCWFELSVAKTKYFSLTLTMQGVSNKHCLLTFSLNFQTCLFTAKGIIIIIALFEKHLVIIVITSICLF